MPRRFSVALLGACCALALSCSAVVDPDSYFVRVCVLGSDEGCGVGETCRIGLGGVNYCETTGTVPIGGQCSASAQCGPVAECTIFALPSTGICSAYCDSDDDCTAQPRANSCIVEVNRCVQGCRPDRPSNCPPGVQCFYLGSEGFCAGTGPRGPYEECGLDSVDEFCMAGTQCTLFTSGSALCLTQCGGSLPACGPGTSCFNPEGGEPVVGAQFGVCFDS